MIFHYGIGITHHASHVEEVYMNASYGLIRMYVKGKFFLYATTHDGKEADNVEIEHHKI